MKISLPMRAVLYSLDRVWAVLSDYSTSLHPKTDIVHEPPGGTYFHTTLDEEIRILILIDLREIEAVFESQIAGFVDIIPESLIAHP